MTANCVVRGATCENALAVRYLVCDARGFVDDFRSSVTHRENREDLWLDDALPESTELLTAGDGEQICVGADHRVNRARYEIRCVNRICVSELKNFSARDF